MKLVKNKLFIEKKIGPKSCWNLILPLENKIGRWIEIWAKSNHWIITQTLGFNSNRWITSSFNLDHQMYKKLTVGGQTKSEPSDQCGETRSRWMSSRCKASLTKLHVMPLLSRPRQSGSKPPTSSLLLVGPIAAARQTHHPARRTQHLNSLSLCQEINHSSSPNTTV